MTTAAAIRPSVPAPGDSSPRDNGEPPAVLRAEDARILFIEDDDLCVDLTRSILVDRGFASELTVIAGSMAEASTALGVGVIDVVLADLTLPDAYGLDVVRRCHALAPNVPIIVLTGCSDIELALEALTIGAEDYLIKSEFDDEKLMRAIRYSLARSLAGATSTARHPQRTRSVEPQARAIQQPVGAIRIDRVARPPITGAHRTRARRPHDRLAGNRRRPGDRDARRSARRMLESDRDDARGSVRVRAGS
jgi:DNA-binding response OmpR family regulator